MTKILLNIPFIIVLVILLSSCTNYKTQETTKPENLIGQDDFTQLLLDVRMTEVIIRQEISNEGGNNSDSITKRYYDFVFDKHNTNSKQFKNSLEYYSKQPAIMVEINNALVDSLNVLEDKVRKR